MRQLRMHRFALPEGADFEALLGDLPGSLAIEQTDHQVGQRCYYDTFDWRLYRSRMVFFSSGNRLYLERFNGRPVVVGSGRKRAKFFWWDIETDELRTQLKPCIEMRALVPIVEVAAEKTHFRILNNDRKTVVRLMVRNDRLVESNGDLAEQIVIHEIRGYEGEYEAVVALCRHRGWSETKKKKLFRRMLALAGHSPRDYGDKFSVALKEEMSVGQAVSRICLSLMEDMQKNRPGVIADVDSEFLHDFRIAVRRTRSLLSLMKKVLPPQRCAQFQSEFRWLGSVTGPLRDIDVYLLEKDDYLALLPDALKEGMNIFFEQLEVQRAGVLRDLQIHLESERYDQLLHEWRSFLSDPASELFQGPGEQNCRKYADSMIFKRFRNLIRAGDKITASSADEELHQLRIRGKKFRYLLEFFKSFYREEQMTAFLKYMKKLQDNLGVFNDLSVQQDMLLGELDGLRAKNLQTIRFAAALGGLIAVLAEKHQTVRGEFEATYDDFTRPQVGELLQAMVGGSW